MSLLHNQTSANQKDYFFLLANASTINVGNLNAQSISTNTLAASSITTTQLIADTFNISSLVAEYISSTVLSVSSIVSDGKIDANIFSSIFTYAFEGTVSTLFTEHIVLDQATLDVVGGNVLLLNGVPLATTSTSISSLEEWSYYPALSSINLATNNLLNVGNINSQNIFNALNIQSDTAALMTNLTSPAATITSVRNTNFSTVNAVASNLMTPSLLGGSALFSTIQTSSITAPSVRGGVGVFSTINVSSINGVSSLDASSWARFPAVSNVNMNGFDIAGGAQPVFTIAATSNLTETAGVSYCNVVDRGIDVTGAALINLNAKNGLQGSINIQADPGIAGVFGRVDITANGGTTGGIGTGGLININANTPLGFSNATSAVKINAAGINSYAGLIPSVGSLAGYNFIYGTNGVNICTGIPSVFPNIPTTTYLYGLGGIVLNSDVYTSAIYPYWDGISASNGDLLISGRTVNLTNQVYVNLSNVRNMSMDFFATIQNVKGITFCNSYSNNFISNANTIQGTGTVSGYTSMSAGTGNFTNVSGTGTVSGYTTISATNGSFPTLSNTNLVGAGTGQITGYSNITATLGGISSLRTSSLTSYVMATSSINVSSIQSPVYGSEFRIVNTLPGSSQGGSGPNAVSRLIAEKPSGISTVAQIVAADTGMAVAAFKKDGTLTNMLLNASTISTSAATFDSLSFGCSTINGQKLPYPYGSFTANFDQTLGAELAISTIYDTTEYSNGIVLANPSTAQIYVRSAGLYRWIASPQFDTASGGQNTVDFWFQLNGVRVPRSASRMTIQNNGELFTSIEILLQMAENDYIETCFTSADTNMNLSYFPASGIVPEIPAIILNGQKIADV